MESDFSNNMKMTGAFVTLPLNLTFMFQMDSLPLGMWWEWGH